MEEPEEEEFEEEEEEEGGGVQVDREILGACAPPSY